MTLASLNTEYRIPKREITAEVTVLGHPRKVVKLFLSERAGAHAGAERPSDLLNESGAFFPVVESPGKVIFLRRDAVLVVSVAAESEFLGDQLRPADLPADPGNSQEVEVILEDGTEIRGAVSFLMPEGKQRLLDFLNSGERFITVREANVARLINKRRMVRVTLL